MPDHAVVSPEAWLEARKAFLQREKELTHLRDVINRERLALPWVRVEKEYVFDTEQGPKTLAGLFQGRSQLIVYHFMLGPGWEGGCPGCSFLVDHVDGALPHLNHHDVTFTAVSRAPLPEIQAYKGRMGWKFPWVSSFGSDFNFDFHVSFTQQQIAEGITYNYEQHPGRDGGETELPGMSAFFRDADGTVFHTFSSYARGIEDWIGTLMIFDRAPLGRNESRTMSFLKRHDEYETKPQAAACCHGE